MNGDGSEFMREAIRLAEESVRGGGGPFGCVVVHRGSVVGSGANQVTATNDPTAHAEIVAIRDAARRLGAFRLDDCELYATCEPCPMCLGAIYWARIAKIFYANTRADAAAIGFDDDRFYRELALPLDRRALPMESLLRDEAQPAFRAWTANPGKVSY